METIECIICGKCESLVYNEGKTAKKCPYCGNVYTGKEIGVPVITEIHLESRTPGRDETHMLKKTEFKRKKLSSGEIKLGIILIICGIIICPLAIMLGIHVFENYIGPGIIFWGVGAFLVAIGAAVAFCAGINFLVRNPRKKSLKKALEWVWSESYGSVFNFDSKNEYKDAYLSVIRCVPNTISDKINEETIKEYLLKLKNYFRAVLDEKTKGMNPSSKLNIKKSKRPLLMNDWTGKLILSKVTVEDENEVENGVKTATGSFTFTKVFSCKQGEYEYKLDAALLLIKVHNYYIKTGEYWFPYDLMPEIKETINN
jgi:hypothetical protein